MAAFEIKTISRDEARPFIEGIHYAHRFPPIQFLFGLLEDGVLKGTVSYGPPASPQVAKSVFGGLFKERILELNRLVLDTTTKNAASFLVGRSLRQLTVPSAIVSYADGLMGHVGYIYQATNFLFCGGAKAHDNYYMVDGKMTHPRTLASRGITAPAQWAAENGIAIVKAAVKNRYLFLRGKNSQLLEMRGALKWPVLPYPKGESRRYEKGQTMEELCRVI